MLIIVDGKLWNIEKDRETQIESGEYFVDIAKISFRNDAYILTDHGTIFKYNNDTIEPIKISSEAASIVHTGFEAYVSEDGQLFYFGQPHSEIIDFKVEKMYYIQGCLLLVSTDRKAYRSVSHFGDIPRITYEHIIIDGYVVDVIVADYSFRIYIMTDKGNVYEISTHKTTLICSGVKRMTGYDFIYLLVDDKIFEWTPVIKRLREMSYPHDYNILFFEGRFTTNYCYTFIKFIIIDGKLYKCIDDVKRVYWTEVKLGLSHENLSVQRIVTVDTLDVLIQLSNLQYWFLHFEEQKTLCLKSPGEKASLCYTPDVYITKLPLVEYIYPKTLCCPNKTKRA